ncbi:erythrocyte membrane protein 1 [Plasmodium falciparum RAJ116]|uniref:Erythrocyte membrane protein 1 n=1 Tax=Plasmodium falciparum RAJ116 TaxID=580058 RepID=A0A0L0CSD7_PLAFA|nr:erythrocyte membrane protein 1 [Plasmodium falciparum RAJ116]
MAPGGLLGGGGGTQDDSVKDLFDRIGRTIQQEVNKAAKTYTSELHGDLSKATYPGDENPEKSTPQDPCDLEHSLHTNVTIGGDKEYPCEKRSNVRFSDKEGAECNKSKIKDSKSNCGACAPYRRLHLCDRNLENINDYSKINTKDNLLLEVCLAAKYEGDSIIGEYPKYQNKYGDSGFTTCTMLARSFADIGDIVRGKDLYLGDNRKDREQKQKLQENLNKIFNDIKKNNQSKLGRLSLDQIREYWWEENREKIWKAITCKAQGYKYFLPKCSKDTWSQDKCRCANTGVPTNFDYVPQYLRWFEEWAEDFCRKKNKKLENVKKQCRKKDKNSDDRYCSRNGFDCEKTIRKIELLRMGKGCINCLYACNPYVDWINNQKEQFDKQKQKYTDEINGTSGNRGRQRRAARGSNSDNNGYEKIFYKKLQETEYKDVGKFLNLLSSEKACKEVKDSEGGTIDFEKVNSTSGGTAVGGASGTNDEKKGTFYRSKYCQPCPDCGVKKVNNGGSGNQWEKKNTDQCTRIKLYEPNKDANPTPIRILKSGDGQTEIAEKLKKFCDQINLDTLNSGVNSAGGGGNGGNSEMKELHDEWKCYQFEQLRKVGQGEEDDEYNNEVENAGGLCILQKTNGEGKVNKQKTFNNVFYYWVAHMLKDSIYWRTKKLEKCLKNGTKTKCKNGCNNDCECFKRWVKQKKDEWKPIKDHFKKQKGFKDGGVGLANGLFVLEWNLELEFANENSEEDTQNNVSAEEAKEIRHLREIIKKKKQEEADGGSGTGDPNGQKTLMDKLIEHEEGIAKDCLQKQEECNRQQAAREPAGRSLKPRADEPQTPDPTVGDDDDEDLDEVEEKAEEETAEDSATTEDTVDVCDTVDKILKLDTLKEACSLKYGPKAPSSWKCVTPTTNNDDKGSEGGQDESVVAKRRLKRSAGGKRDATAGSICVPPRRRRLYVTPLTKLTGDNTAASQVDGTTGQSQNGEAASNGPTDPVESLQAQVDEAKGGVQGTEGRVKPNGQTAEGSQSHPVSSAKALEPVGISSQTSEGKTTSKSSGKDPREALRDAFIQSAAVGTFFLWHNYKEQFKAQHGAVEALGGFGTYGVRADGPGLVPFSGPQPTLPQAPFAASQGKVGPAGLGPGAGLPRGQHGQPHGTQLGLKKKGSSLRKSGSSLRKSGSSLRKSGSSLRKSGSSLRKSGSSLRKSGSSLRKSGSSLRKSGSSLRKSGSSLRKSGSSLRKSGSSLRKSGSSLRKSGSSLRKSGSSLRKSGSSLKERGYRYQNIVCRP